MTSDHVFYNQVLYVYHTIEQHFEVVTFVVTNNDKCIASSTKGRKPIATQGNKVSILSPNGILVHKL